MKVLLLAALALSTSALFASTQMETKVCTVLHESKSSKCLTTEKQSFPTTKLIGVSKLKKGESIESVVHTWNGVPASEVITLERGRIVISTYQVPQGHAGTVAFSVSNTKGEVLANKTLEVARGPLSVSANEVKSQEVQPTNSAPVVVVNTTAPVVVKAVQETKPVKSNDDLPTLDHLEANDTAQALSAMAKEGPLPGDEDVTLEETRAAVEPSLPKESRVKVDSYHKDDSGFIWRRFEVHGAFVTQTKKGSSYTVLPYFAPEYRSESFWGFGIKAGATEFKQEKGNNVTAIEGDAHVSFNLRSEKGRLSLQPAFGYHNWGKVYGTNTSTGVDFEIKPYSLPISIVGGAHFWTYKQINYRLVSVGLGMEF